VLYKVSPFRKTVTHHLLVCALLSALSLGSVLAAVFLGPVPLSFSQVVAALLGKGEDKARIIVWELRFPRASLGFLAGAALSLSGAVMQGVFRNPLASPYVLGVAAGSTAGAARGGGLRAQLFSQAGGSLFGRDLRGFFWCGSLGARSSGSSWQALLSPPSFLRPPPFFFS